jgi:hypothetical protein
MVSELKMEVIAVLGVTLAAIYLTRKAAEAAASTVQQVIPKIDPTSDQNIAYQGASSLARWLTGQETGDLGTIAWDYVHKGEPDPTTGKPINYSAAQQAADLKAIQQLEAGYHGM